MEKIIINGGRRLVGKIKASGAKNSVLPIIAASLICPEECVLEDIPFLEDVNVICSVLDSLGTVIKMGEGNTSVRINGQNIITLEPPIDLVTKMRASFLVMGPLLARFGRVRISQPGGCNIGTRPIDLHLKGFSAMGAEIFLDHGCVEASCKKLTGAKIYLDFPSVGATENIMMAAVLADGITVIQNAAEEPEIVDLATFLNKLGAEITGAGTDTIRIEGVRELKAATHQIIPDRIEAGTYMVAAAITGGDLIIENVVMEHLRPIIAKLQEAGAKIIEGQNKLRVYADEPIRAVDLKTLPYPGFPTDMQAQFMALLSLARGTSIVTETVFENRFMHTTELMRMGANIKIEGRSAIIEGCSRLTGAKVKATDLRAGASLLLAGLAAEGRTEITDVHHIDRGYYNMVGKLQSVDADIERASE